MEKAIITLLKPPSLQYIRELTKMLEQDPKYLEFHSASVSLKIRRLVAPGNALDVGLSEREVMQVVKEAIIRLRGIEKVR